MTSQKTNVIAKIVMCSTDKNISEKNMASKQMGTLTQYFKLR